MFSLLEDIWLFQKQNVSHQFEIFWSVQITNYYTLTQGDFSYQIDNVLQLCHWIFFVAPIVLKTQSLIPKFTYGGHRETPYSMVNAHFYNCIPVSWLCTNYFRKYGLDQWDLQFLSPMLNLLKWNDFLFFSFNISLEN